MLYCVETCTWSLSEKRWSRRPLVYHSGEVVRVTPYQLTSTTGLASLVGLGTMLKRYLDSAVWRADAMALPGEGVRLYACSAPCVESGSYIVRTRVCVSL